MVPWKGGLQAAKKISVVLGAVHGEPSKPPAELRHRWQFLETREKEGAYAKMALTFRYDPDGKHKATLWLQKRGKGNAIDVGGGVKFAVPEKGDAGVELIHDLDENTFTVRTFAPELMPYLHPEGREHGEKFEGYVEGNTLREREATPQEVGFFTQVMCGALSKLEYAHDPRWKSILGKYLKAKKREALFWKVVEKAKQQLGAE